jgi:L-alanine-DL-glutamate epimerase-like enolase superfamily enzyme
MKLSAIEATVVYPHDGGGHGIPLIEVHTDQGLTGWGEAQASRVPEAVCDVVCDLLNPALRNRPFHGDREEIEFAWDYLYGMIRTEAESGGFADMAIGAVDMALWDLAGKMQNRALDQILNNDGAREVETFVALPCEDSSALTGSLRTLSEAGIDAFELAFNSTREDLIEALDLAKLTLTDKKQIAVNALWRLGPDCDFDLERQIDQRTPLWVANPLPPEDPFAHSRLSKVMCAPLGLGEAYHTHYELAPFFHELAVGVLQPDLGRCGFTEALRMAEMAKRHGAPVVVRVGESLGPQLAAALQFAALAPDRRVEYNPGRLKRTNGVLSTAIQWEKGKYKVPSAPGLGVQMDEPEIHLMEVEVGRVE